MSAPTGWRVLVVAPFPPRLDGRHGGSKAVAQLLARLASRNAVALLVARADDDPGVDDELRNLCELVEEVRIPPTGRSFRARASKRARLRLGLVRGTPTWAAERDPPGFAERLQELERSWRPDVVQLEYRIAGRYLAALRSSTPRVLVEVDPDVHRFGSGLHDALERRAWTTLGRSITERADAVVVLTERDRQIVAALGGSARIVRVPLAFDLPESPLDPVGKEACGIVSVGSFLHPPNIDAARWLVREIMPAVVARVAGASVRLVGSRPSSEILALQGPAVRVSADVPDVTPYLDAAAVVAVPVRLGGGMRVKTLEALAAGKAIVATPLALAGLDVVDGEHVLVADTAAAFADAIVALLEDENRRARLAHSARRWAEQNLDQAAQLRAYETLYETLADRL